MTMTVREWFRVQRAAAWVHDIAHGGDTQEIDEFADAITAGDLRGAAIILDYLLRRTPYKWGHMVRRAGSTEGIWR